MFFQEIQPFVRFARFLTLSNGVQFTPVVPYDHRLFYLIEGSASVVVDGKEQAVKASGLILIPSGAEYSLKAENEKCLFYAVNFDYFLDKSKPIGPIPPVNKKLFREDAVLERLNFADTICFNEALHLENMKSAENNLFRIHQEYTEKLLHYEIVTSNLFSNILASCARRYASLNANYHRKKSTEILNYLRENYSDPTLSNEKLGKIFFLHKNYINQIVKAETGLSLHKYLLSVRISRAMELLETGLYGVQAIAQQCGFNDIYHFSGYFKKVTGVAPSLYKSKQTEEK